MSIILQQLREAERILIQQLRETERRRMAASAVHLPLRRAAIKTKTRLENSPIEADNTSSTILWLSTGTSVWVAEGPFVRQIPILTWVRWCDKINQSISHLL